MTKRLRAWFDRRFGLETISGDGICPVYLYRWTLLGTRWFKVYLHHFVGNDWSLDAHDHPKRFTIIGLWGSYWEDVYEDGWYVRTDHWRAPWFRTFRAEHQHRIRCEEFSLTNQRRTTAWTLCITGPPRRMWGFWYRANRMGSRPFWVHWKEYVYGGMGEERKDC